MGKGVTWDGKSYLDYRTSDYDYKDSFEHETGGGLSRFDHAGYAEDMAYGTGSRKNFLEPLYDAGIPADQFDYYAKKAGIKNVNSKSDLQDIITVYNDDERYQGGNEGSKSKEKKKKKDKYKPPVTTPEQQEEYDKWENIIDTVEGQQLAALERSTQPFDRFSDYDMTYDRFSDKKSYDMRKKDKDKESQDFANNYKLDVINSIIKPKEV